MPNILALQVENPNEIRNTGAYDTGALMRVQSSATEAGAFADLTGTGSTPTVAVLADTRSYTAYDPNGIVSTWYRTRFENAAGTRVSDWAPAFQTGDETAGLLCSVYDVEQEVGTLSANDRETVLDKIRQVSVAIEGYCDRWFAPRPTNPTSTATYRVHSRYGRRLWFPKGIRSITTLGLASSDQPASGGTYSVATVTDYFLDPPEMDRSVGWPATSVRLRDVSSAIYYDAYYGAEVTGSFGWAAVPYDIQGVALRAVVRRFIGKGSGGASIPIGPEGTLFLLPDMAGADRAVLDYYRHQSV